MTENSSDNNDDNTSIFDEFETMSWIDAEEYDDEFYNAFYDAPIETIQIIQILIDKEQEPDQNQNQNQNQKIPNENVSQSRFQLETPGKITSEELLPIIRCQTKLGYKPFLMLKYAVDVDVSQIKDFAETEIETQPKSQSQSQSQSQFQSQQNFMQEVFYTQDIEFTPSAKIFEAVASLFIIYKKSNKKTVANSHNRTRSASHKNKHTRLTKRKTKKANQTSNQKANQRIIHLRPPHTANNKTSKNKQHLQPNPNPNIKPPRTNRTRKRVSFDVSRS